MARHSTADYLVLAAGSQPEFFHTPGADQYAYPLYSLDDATRLRSRILSLFEEADRDRALIDQGALDFVIVGGGPTGVEVAGALAEMINTTIATEYHDLPPGAAKVHLVNHGPELLSMFAAKAHTYTAKVLAEGRRRPPVRDGRDGHRAGPCDPQRRVDDQDAVRRLGRRPEGRADREARRGWRRAGAGGSTSDPDLAVAGFPGVYVVGDIANIPDTKAGQDASATRVRRDAERRARRQDIRAAIDGKSAQAVPLPRQGHDGDDRPRGGRRAGPAASSSTASSPSRPGSASMPP